MHSCEATPLVLANDSAIKQFWHICLLAQPNFQASTFDCYIPLIDTDKVTGHTQGKPIRLVIIAMLRERLLSIEIIVQENYAAISQQAAALIADLVRSKPTAVLGLATGSTPLGLYQELIRLHQEEGLDFSQVTTFNLDEYVGLAADHPQSYHYFMHDNLFRHINVPAANIHIPDGTTSDTPAFCESYEQLIASSGGIDLQVLGIGSDGHIAFNEPGSSLDSRTRVETLAKQTIEDNARFFASADDVPIHAITMGVGTILDARKIILIANGANKAPAVAAAAEGPVSSMCTASALQNHPDTIFFLDPEAASQLQKKTG